MADDSVADLIERLNADRDAAVEEATLLTERLRALNGKVSAFDRTLEGLAELYPDIVGTTTNTSGSAEPARRVRVVRRPDGSFQKVRIDTGTTSRGPRSRDAAAIILADHPEEWLTVEDVVEGVKAHGWDLKADDPVQAYRIALTRLHQAGGARRRKNDSGVYEFAVPVAAEDVDSSLDAESPALTGLSDPVPTSRKDDSEPTPGDQDHH